MKDDSSFKYLGEIFNKLTQLDSLSITFSPSPKGSFSVTSFYDGLKDLKVKTNLSIKNSFDTINSSAVKFITRNTTLQKIQVLYEKFDSKMIKQLVSEFGSFTNLRKLFLGSNNKLSDSTLNDIANNIVKLPRVSTISLGLEKSEFNAKSIVLFF